MKSILFVEDDREYQIAIHEILTKEGYQVDDVPGPIEAIEAFEEDKYDLVISDFKMDAMDGVRFLKYIKRISPNVRTMILTASPTVESELESLNIQIDKYLVKETRIDVLLKYIEYLMSLPIISKKRKHETLEALDEDLIIDIDARVVMKNGVKVQVSPKEYGILKMLLEQRGFAVSRDTLLEELWDTNHEIIDSRVIDVHMKSIRKKLQLQSIVSVRGYGYKWDE